MTASKWAIICGICLFTIHVFGQSRTPDQEYLVVVNPLDRPALVFMTSKGGGVKDNRKQPFNVAPQTEEKIQFIGRQPYDITIVYGDNSYAQFDNAKVCDWMQKCRDFNITDEETTITIGRVETDATGRRVYVPLPSKSKVHVQTDFDTVRIPKYQFASTVPDEPRDPRRPQ